jgi:Cu(I)-responsive transcriptional regulator
MECHADLRSVHVAPPDRRGLGVVGGGGETHVNIGEAAKRSGVSAKMIRYYERVGLIAKATRSEAGYRHYADADLNRLRFIHRARDLGFPVGQIAELLSLWDNKSRSNSEVKRMAESHIGALHEKITALQSMVKTLKRLTETCQGDGRAHCPILEDLAHASAPLAVQPCSKGARRA